MPATFSCQLLRAVRISTGILRPAARQWRSTDRPSSSGRPRSSTTASKSPTSPRYCARARRPQPTVWPAAAMACTSCACSVLVLDHQYAMARPFLAFFAFDLQHLAIDGIHLELGHAAVALQQADFVDEAAVVLLNSILTILTRRTCARPVHLR